MLSFPSSAARRAHGVVVAHESIIEAITAFNATAALAPPGTGAEIVAPLIASGELSSVV